MTEFEKNNGLFFIVEYSGILLIMAVKKMNITNNKIEED